MSDTNVATVIKMFEALPDSAQERVAEHLCEYIEDLRDEMRWDAQFQASQPALAAAARQARGQIAKGQSTAMDLEAL